MINQDALRWLREHWSPEYLESNCWVAVSAEGVIAVNQDFEMVLNNSEKWSLDSIVFAYASFELWQ
jgi:hypothetical protein